MTAAEIRTVAAEEIERDIDAFGELMHACVHGGGSVGYVLPYSLEDAADFWRKNVIGPVRGGGRTVLGAFVSGHLAGSVQLDIDTPPNQPHRAEARKLLVHPDFRRRGIARALMEELERHARMHGRWLVTLDTRTGDAAEPLYLSMGYLIAGKIPDWCRDNFTERYDPTTILYKKVG
ncbi:MAG: GNAT family N-acetyltransferase [Alphaproteobacteria bacterium]|nr:GNAT family N-acetyltransferase [Alphaproteobacteria bacterium]